MIEVLVVMTVISVVAAFMLPAYSSVKKRTLDVSCISKLGQIGNAIMLYASDHGHYPHSSQFDYQADWGEALLPYMLPPKSFKACNEPWASPGMNMLSDGSFEVIDRDYSQNRYNYFMCPAGRPAVQGFSASFKYTHNYACNEFLMTVNYHKRYMDTDGAPGIQYGSDYLPPSGTPGKLSRASSTILIADCGIQPVLKDFDGNGQPDALGDAPDTFGGVAGTIVADFYFNPTTASSRGNWPIVTLIDYEPEYGVDPGLYAPSDAWPVYWRHRGKCNALMADGHVQQFANGEMKRRNFVERGRAAMMSPGEDPDLLAYIDILYP
jgi:prepilin-type processing-associated H-X9-DG protein